MTTPRIINVERMKASGATPLQVKEKVRPGSREARELFEHCAKFALDLDGTVRGEEGTEVVTFEGTFGTMESCDSDDRGPWHLSGVTWNVDAVNAHFVEIGVPDGPQDTEDLVPTSSIDLVHVARPLRWATP